MADRKYYGEMRLKTAISKARCFHLLRDVHDLVVTVNGRTFGHWPHVAPLLPADVVELFAGDLAKHLDWELGNLLVVVD